MNNKITNKYLGKKALMSYSQISLLVFAIVSMSFMIGMMGEVKGVGEQSIVNGVTWTKTTGGLWTDGVTFVQALPSASTGATPALGVLTGGSMANVPLATGIAGRMPLTLITQKAEVVNLIGGSNLPIPAGTSYTTTALENGITKVTLSQEIDGVKTFALPKGVTLSGVPSTGGSSWLSKFLSGGNIVTGGAWDAVIGGAQWAGLAFGAGYALGSLFGMEEGNKMALSIALAAGAGIGKFIYVSNLNILWAKGSMIGAGLIGIGIGATIFLMMYKKTEQRVVEFQCLPWQAPRGGANCEKCNNELKPCTEYRCKSLGQLCELENKGTGKELCLAVDIRETDPPIIKPNTEELTQGFKYTNVKTSPPAPGFEIKPISGADCIKPYTPINFGISTFYSDGTPAPSRCKIDIKHTTKFDDMAYWFGGTPIYAYNHTESLMLPNTKDLANSSLILENGKTMIFYMRCEGKNDKNNVNPAEYMLRMCIDPSPDRTVPQIKATSLFDESCIGENKNSALVDFYVSEPAECKWSHEDRSFDQMENNLICPNSARQINSFLLYTCVANLTGIKREKTDIFVKCKDQPELKGKNESSRNTMSQSYKYSLRSSDGLRITKVTPSGNIYSGATPTAVNLYVETSAGCDDGKAICYYSLTGNTNDYIAFFETDTPDGIHNQPIYLGAGKQNYYVKCIDGGGNIATNISEVNVQILTGGPIIARAYVSQETNKLKIATLRKSECAYSFEDCDFTFKQGVEMPYANETIHVADLRMDKTYYIKCRDEYSSEPAGCSITLKPQLLV